MSTVISILKMPIWVFLGFFLACCFISGITGEVPDGVVYTDLHKNALLGSRAVLKCEFYGAPIAVSWRKGDNPSTSPNLITWVEGEPDSGSCVKDKTCEMGDNYSLNIKNASIADQGRYICRVSNYRGILLHNFTDVKVLAPPEEPYPIINECKENQGQNCILPATGPVNITCTVLKYFPNVDLFFLHGIQKYSIIETVEWTNPDGTKSKSIFTTAPPSETPYGCVAFNIPGSQEQRTATVTVPDQNDGATTPSSRLPRPSGTGGPIEPHKYLVIKIVVPIIAAFCVVTGIILFSMRYRRGQRRRENKNDDEHGEAMPMFPRKKIDGKVSYYELWRLFREIEDTAVLRNTLRELGKTDIKEDLSEQEGYEILCKWKDKNRSGNEGKILNKALSKVMRKEDYDRARDFFCANKKNSSMKIYQHTLEHILWDISDLKKINKFVDELIPSRPTTAFNDSVDAMQSALRELTEWSNGQLDLNPYISLSFALERTKCRPVAKTFFLHKLPEELTLRIEPKTVNEIVQKLTGRHCKRLMAVAEISNDKLGSIIAENNEFLFDTKTMISDWLRKLECSDFEKRCRFDDALIKIGRYDLLDCFGTVSRRPLVVLFKEQQNLFDHDTIYDDDIPQLVKLIKCLPPDKISEFNKKTGFSADRDDSMLEEDLRGRRDNILTRSTSQDALSQEFRSLRRELTKHTGNFDSTVTDEEIEAVASLVTAADKQQELLRCLGIEAGAPKNISFADHLKKWLNTEANSRKGIQDLLRHIGFGDSTVTNEEIEAVASQVTAAEKQELSGCLGIEAGTPKNISFADYLKKWLKTEANSRKGIQDSLRHIGFGDSTVTVGELEAVGSQVTAAEKQQELPGCLGIEAGAPQNISFADHLKKWRKTKTNSRKGIQDSLRHIGFGECIVRKSSKKFVYQVELFSIALNLLMEDVRPVIEALGIDRRTVSSYIHPVSKQNKGTKGLVLKLLRSLGGSEKSRDDFSKVLQCIGFGDFSRSVYFDYEPSLSELIYIVDFVGKGWMDRFLEHLDISPDDIEECRESEAQIDKLKVMRVWKRQIRPVPYHYRLEIAKALRDVELNGIAKGVLSGEYRRKGLNADVLQGIYSRMGDEGLTRLCSSLKLGSESTSRSLEASTALVTKWVNEWMNKFNPNDTSVTSGHMHHVHRKRMNDELYANGFCELAEEISAVENCQQSAQ